MLSEIINSIPESIQGIVVGSLMTFLGIIINNRHSERLLLVQLEKSARLATETEKEREKRSILLEAISSIAETRQAIIREFSQVRMNYNFFLDQKPNTSVARLSAVASPVVIDAYSDIVNYFSLMAMDCLRSRPSIEKASTEVQVSNQQQEECLRKSKELIEEYSCRLRNGTFDEVFKRMVESEIDSLRAWRVDAGKRHSKAFVCQFSAQIALNEKICSHMSRVVELEGALIVAIRADLGSSPEAEFLLTFARKQIKEGERQVEIMMQWLRELVAEESTIEEETSTLLTTEGSAKNPE